MTGFWAEWASWARQAEQHDTFERECLGHWAYRTAYEALLAQYQVVCAELDAVKAAAEGTHNRRSTDV